MNLGYTTIKSPIKGVIIDRRVNVGQTVVASLNAPSLFLIAKDLKKLQVWASVSEADVGPIRSGQAVTFTVDAYPNDVFRATVEQVRLAPQTVQNVVTYTAVIDVANPDLKLKPGMTANVTVVAAQRDSVLTVPNNALRFRKTANGALSAYVPKKDLEEPIVAQQQPDLWGGQITLGNGWVLELPPMAPGTGLPVTVEARKVSGGS